MDIGKKPWIALAAGIFLIMSALLSVEALAVKLDRMNSETGLDKIVISPLYAGGYQSQDRIEIEELEKLQEKMSGNHVTAAASEKAVAEFEGKSMDVVINAVDASFTSFRYLDFVRGGHWSSDTDIEQGMVAVIDVEAAVGLFGSMDVLGMILELSDHKYRIIGVVQEKTPIICRLFNDRSCNIYIPVSSLLENNEEIKISELQIADNGDGTMDMNGIEAALRYIGESPAEHNIIDFRKKKQQLYQKSKLIVFFIGLLIEIMMLKLIKRILSKTLMGVKEECKADYLTDVLKRRHKELLGSMAAILMLLCLAVFVGLTIRFDLYLPANLVPDELIDLKSWGELIENKLQEGNESLVQYRSLTDIQFSRINMLQNFILIVFVPVGFALLHSGYSSLRLNRRDTLGTVALMAAVLASEASIWLLLSLLNGLPASVSLHGLVILWGFIFLKTILYLYEGDLLW